MSQFSPELCKLEPSNMVYICRMSDCIVGLRLRVMALIFLFFIHFSSPGQSPGRGILLPPGDGVGCVGVSKILIFLR